MAIDYRLPVLSCMHAHWRINCMFLFYRMDDVCGKRQKPWLSLHWHIQYFQEIASTVRETKANLFPYFSNEFYPWVNLWKKKIETVSLLYAFNWTIWIDCIFHSVTFFILSFACWCFMYLCEWYQYKTKINFYLSPFDNAVDLVLSIF